MEKLEKKKHDHKPTKILKFLIFMFVMFAPFFSVLSKCLYTLNPNAKDSYYGETINEEIIKTDTLSNLISGNRYTYYAGNRTFEQFNTITLVVSDIVREFNGNKIEYSSANQFQFSITNNNNYIFIRNNSAYVDDWNNNSSNIATFTFTFIDYNGSTELPTNFNEFTYYEYNKFSYIDNVFEYSVNQLKNDTLYNWSKNTGIYTAIEGMVQGLGANEVLSMLLAYWGILTAIYIVFDIVIECFIKITHMFTE